MVVVPVLLLVSVVVGVLLVVFQVLVVVVVLVELRSASSDQWKPPVVHRDVSSSNVLVRDDLSCVVTDFGLSMMLTGNTSCRRGDEDTTTISEVRSHDDVW